MGASAFRWKAMGTRRKILVVFTLLISFISLHILLVFQDISWKSFVTQSLSPYAQEFAAISSTTQHQPTASVVQSAIMDNESVNRTYFFVETSNRTSFTPREACAIESVARMHPNNSVQVFYMATEFNHSHPLRQTLNNYSNIVIKQTDLDALLTGSPMEHWIKTRPWTKSAYNVSHLSDIMRSLLMWKYGGVYLDMDIVVLRSLNDLHNTIGLQSDEYLAAGVLIFDKGHPLINASAYELASSYRHWSWGYNGPELYMRTLKRLCNVTRMVELRRRKCYGVTVMPPSAFYPIFYTVWRKYFYTNNAADTVMQWLHSYTIHLWNKLAEKEAVKIGSGQPYELAAKYFCPRIYNYMKPFKVM